MSKVGKDVRACQARRYMHWLFNSYVTHRRNQELQDTLESVSSLLVGNIATFKSDIEEAYQEITSVVQEENSERMLTIRQEAEDEECIYETDPSLKSINRSIADIRYLDRKSVQVIHMYKQELKRLATDVYKWEKRNKELKARLKRQEEVDENTQDPPPKTEDKKLWDCLNKKLEGLKKNLKMYQEEIKEKDAEISKLKSSDGCNKELEKEAKGLKRSLTTLRGEKTLMVSQYEGLRKLLSTKQQVLEIQNQEMDKYKLEIQYLSDSLREAKSSLASQGRENEELRRKNRDTLDQLDTTHLNMSCYVRDCSKQELQQLRADNLALSRSMQDKRKKAQCLSSQLKELQESCQEALLREKKKLHQVQQLLSEKNESIVRLKSVQPEEKYEYYVELVKLLTKKVFDRDQTIQRMRAN